ncbi:hypothetical protein AUP68_13047 [Ilyonectria robusta]
MSAASASSRQRSRSSRVFGGDQWMSHLGSETSSPTRGEPVAWSVCVDLALAARRPR